MKTFSFYHRDTGVIHPASFSSTNPDDAALNTPAEHIAMEGKFDPLSQCVDITTGAVLDYQPPTPSPDHEWVARRWQLSLTAQTRIDQRAAAVARIAVLIEAQHAHVRQHCLGVVSALDHLRAIDDEIAKLEKVQATCR